MSGRIRWFFENFGKPPETVGSPLIPPKWRMPVFFGMIVVGIVLLLLLVRFVVIPGMAAQRALSAPSGAPTTSQPNL